MYRTLCTAVAAVADKDLRKRMPMLLSCADVELVYLAEDAEDALRAVIAHRSDLLIVDAFLPVIGGEALVEHVLTMGLPVRPECVLMIDPMLRGGCEADRAEILTHPIAPEDMRDCVDRLRRRPPALDPDLLCRAKQIVRELGFEDHAGTKCIVCAAVLCAQDERYMYMPRQETDAVIGEICACPRQSVDRAMRHAIEVAWRSDKIENQHRIFGDTIDEKRGWPTCREMIARIVDILCLEGCT